MFTLTRPTETMAKGRPEPPQSSWLLSVSLFASTCAIISGSTAILNIIQQGGIARIIHDIGMCSLSIFVIFLCLRAMKRRQVEYETKLKAYEAGIRTNSFDIIDDDH
ncbi:MAG TPA: hypothetical protein VEZ59_07910 [Sphingopyxis sp.]|nr:hypothetical protein [Sphingopyxis sp.]